MLIILTQSAWQALLQRLPVPVCFAEIPAVSVQIGGYRCWVDGCSVQPQLAHRSLETVVSRG